MKKLILLTLVLSGCAIKTINKNCVQTQDSAFWVCDSYPWTR